MGCSIHIIMEIKKDGKWSYVPEIPKVFKIRNYSLFGFLANVNNNFATEGFKPKGLPEDISSKKFIFDSKTEHLKKSYRINYETKVKLPDGSFISSYDERLNKLVSEEEAKNNGSWSCIDGNYTIRDVSLVNGEYVNIPYSEIMTEEEYLNKSGDWDEDAKDYGTWEIDFDSNDYHSMSYLSLKELQEKDLTDYCSIKCKIAKEFYDKFIEFGGEMPNEFTVKTERKPGSFIDAIHYAFEPDVIVSWPANEEEIKENSLVIGIKELEKIANQHNVKAEDIRIVFAFDN